MPFITEEIWQSVASYAGNKVSDDSSSNTIMLQRYPVADLNKINQQAIDDIEWVKAVIVAIRNIRGEMNIAPGKPLPILLKNGSELDRCRLADGELFLKSLGRIESIHSLANDEPTPAVATQLVGELEVMVPLAGLIDKQAELDRLDKEIGKLSKETQRLAGKLSNKKFVANAPADVVAKEQQKLADAESAKQRLEAQRAELDAM